MPDARPLANDIEHGLLQEILRVVRSDAELKPRHPHETRELRPVEQKLLRDIEAAARRLDLDFH